MKLKCLDSNTTVSSTFSATAIKDLKMVFNFVNVFTDQLANMVSDYYVDMEWVHWVDRDWVYWVHMEQVQTHNTHRSSCNVSSSWGS